MPRLHCKFIGNDQVYKQRIVLMNYHNGPGISSQRHKARTTHSIGAQTVFFSWEIYLRLQRVGLLFASLLRLIIYWKVIRSRKT